jgi:hypothetical protein
MGYEHLFAAHDLALLHDWLQENGELYIDLDRPHSGGSNTSVHFVTSLAELRAIVSRETWPEVSISIFRVRQYTLRGVANQELLAAALEQIPDRQYFTILSACIDPLAPCSAIGWGEGHAELRNAFGGLEGQQVWVGQDPFDLPPLNHETRFLNSPDQVFVVRSYRNPPRVIKNRSGYDAFDVAPQRYLRHIRFW